MEIIDHNKDEKEPKEELSSSEKINRMYDIFEGTKEGKKRKKPKEFRIPAKGKVSKSKMKKGWMIIEKINENRNISFEKQQCEMEVYKTDDGIYHATDGGEIYYYKGMPLVLQPAWRQNPNIIGQPIPTPNNVYGQKPMIAKMTFDTYKEARKKKGGGGSLLVVLGVLVVGYLALHYVFHVF